MKRTCIIEDVRPSDISRASNIAWIEHILRVAELSAWWDWWSQRVEACISTTVCHVEMAKSVCFLPSKHLLSAFYKALPSKNPSKNLVFTEGPRGAF